ncbi:MAG: hypothetical protein NWE95_01795 [Candidatus Bathyarchaeota archaeon]|nr:hypothetical protein [Candidatus Bathyarchaeota archaeon]
MAKEEDTKKTGRYRRSYIPSSYIDYLIDLYRRNPNLLQQMRRGYKSRLNSPSRRRNPGASSTYRSRTAYAPRIYHQLETANKLAQKPATNRSSYQPWQEPSKNVPPITRVQPDVEQTIKKLEKRLEKVLQEQVHESLEAELNELKTTLAGKETIEDMQQKEKENAPEIEKQEQENKNETMDGESAESSQKHANEINPEPKPEASEPAEKQETAKNEMQSELSDMDELYNEEDELEWLREEVEDTDLNETVENAEVPTMEKSQVMEQPLSPLEALEAERLEAIQQPEMLPNYSAPLESPLEMGPEQVEDLEPLLDQIEPIGTELIQPIEAASMPGILPELMPENIEGVTEPTEATEGQVY